MNQAKLESAIEIFFNYASGFIVAWAVYAFIVMPLPWLSTSPFWVTGLFTIVSIIRSYIWRRFFNSGLHLVIHRFAIKLINQ